MALPGNVLSKQSENMNVIITLPWVQVQALSLGTCREPNYIKVRDLTLPKALLSDLPPTHPPPYPSAPTTLDLEIFWINQVFEVLSLWTWWGFHPVSNRPFPPLPLSTKRIPTKSFQTQPRGHVSSPPPLSDSPFRFARHFCTHLYHNTHPTLLQLILYPSSLLDPEFLTGMDHLTHPRTARCLPTQDQHKQCAQ